MVVVVDGGGGGGMLGEEAGICEGGGGGGTIETGGAQLLKLLLFIELSWSWRVFNSPISPISDLDLCFGLLICKYANWDSNVSTVICHLKIETPFKHLRIED